LARFQSRERVILVRFSEEVAPPVRIDFGAEGDHSQEARAIHDFDAGLSAHGGTAIFSALARAFAIADEERVRDPDRLVIIVLLTDGESRDGISFSTLADRIQGRAAPRTFPILFGEAKSDELERVAQMTGGRVFDGRSGALTNVFREIRGYQ